MTDRLSCLNIPSNFVRIRYRQIVRMSSILLSLCALWIGVGLSIETSSKTRGDEPVDLQEGRLLKKGGGLFGNGTNGNVLRGGLAGGFGPKSKEPYQFTATYTLDSSLRQGIISVNADLDPGYYIYSVTQPKGGPMRTTISISSSDITLREAFRSESPPTISDGERGFENVQVEKHLKHVTWVAPFESAQPLTIDQQASSSKEILLKLNGQVCREGACIPLQNIQIVATLLQVDEANNLPPTGLAIPSPRDADLVSNDGPPMPGLIVEPTISSEPSEAMNGLFKASKSRVSWRAEFSQSKIGLGSSAQLLITAITDEPFHLYEVRPKDTSIESSTTIAITDKSNLKLGPPVASESATKVELIPGQLSVSYHSQQVTWSIPIQVPIDASLGEHRIEGKIGYQACTDSSCEDPMGLKFSGILRVVGADTLASQLIDRSSEFQFEPIPFATAAMDPSRLTWIDTLDSLPLDSLPIDSTPNDLKPNDSPGAETHSVASLPLIATARHLSPFALFGYFGLAMVGGLVLNLMPCVLPVIGLKVMSFVQEGKESGKSISSLNLWYVAGIMSVFIVLALITIIAREAYHETFGWGSQFGSFGFRLGLTVLMFAMALSFLGVWEIPIPGFATGKQSGEMMRREGATGAYFKGLLTTVLATPCSGPGLGAVFSLSIDQSPWVILLMYFGVGLGMSFPYIVIAFNPSLLAWMPKPGPWMQTLKEGLAFPLLLSVVWFLTTFQDDYRIAVVTTLIFVWLACWWIGKVPPWAEIPFKLRNWTGATAIAIAGSLFAMQFLGPYKHLIDWQQYDESRLVDYRSQGHAVMIDFTAQWCANCKVNLATAIETKGVAAVIRQQGIVPMIADHTDLPSHITKKLEELRSTAIPVLAIYPAGLSNPPIIMRDLVTEKQVIAALKRATTTKSVRTVSHVGTE